MARTADSGDTIAAISTPLGEGGIGIVRMSGPFSLKIADRIFASSVGALPSSFKSYTTHYGHIVDRKPGRRRGPVAGRERPLKGKRPRVIDEVLLTVMRAPKSYTKEDVVEVNCHGGIQALRKVYDMMLEQGARVAEPGEFTKRAFLNGRIDLARAEAVLDVIRAKTEGSLKVAVDQLEGGLSRRVDAFREELTEVAAHIEASIDFPDEGLKTQDSKRLAKRVTAVLRGIEKLIATFGQGMVFREGVLATICGKPNVGKSSLMNLLLKRDRVIVSPIPGTTRDAVEETINLKGIPVRIADTAGISPSADPLDSEGIKRSRRYLDLADIVIIVLDASERMDERDRAIIKLAEGKKKVVVLNKCDLPRKIDMRGIKRLLGGAKAVEISVTENRNIVRLETAITAAIFSGAFTQGEGALVSNARHKELLDKALDSVISVKRELEKGSPPELIAVDLKEAIYCLGLITGGSVSGDILDRIFERFCIGK